jgi:hypothetical protein
MDLCASKAIKRISTSFPGLSESGDDFSIPGHILQKHAPHFYIRDVVCPRLQFLVSGLENAIGSIVI